MNLLRKKSVIRLLVLSAAFSAQPSYSDYVFGHTNNAVTGGIPWGMSSSLFPVYPISGTDINGVFIRYTADKDLNDPYTVSVQNEAANGSGYIFQSTDDWSGGSGGTIQKFVPVPYSPVADWGDGSIEQTGIGDVKDAVVLYSYRFDPSRVQPESQEAYDFSAIPTYDPLSDRYVLNALEPTDPDLYDQEEEVKYEDEEKEDERLEVALAASENAITLAGNVTQGAMVRAMNVATNMNSYYSRQIAGGVYQETVVLKDKNITDNKRALRSLAQDRRHDQMVNQQYGR